ncbi:MAG: hypothetical protein ACRCTJ_07420 [Brevinema sp.]
MKKLALLFVLATTVTSVHATNNYSTGNIILGIGLGAGTATINPVGSPQLTVNPSVELILGAWTPSKVGVAVGLTLDSSANFFGFGTTGTLATMATLHLTLAKNFDWYTSLGMGMQLRPIGNGSIGVYRLHAGFQTGFNFMITQQVFLYMGMALHADEFFGATGVKIRFGNYKKLN